DLELLKDLGVLLPGRVPGRDRDRLGRLADPAHHGVDVVRVHPIVDEVVAHLEHQVLRGYDHHRLQVEVLEHRIDDQALAAGSRGEHHRPQVLDRVEAGLELVVPVSVLGVDDGLAPLRESGGVDRVAVPGGGVDVVVPVSAELDETVPESPVQFLVGPVESLDTVPVSVLDRWVELGSGHLEREVVPQLLGDTRVREDLVVDCIVSANDDGLGRHPSPLVNLCQSIAVRQANPRSFRLLIVDSQKSTFSCWRETSRALATTWGSLSTYRSTSV